MMYHKLNSNSWINQIKTSQLYLKAIKYIRNRPSETFQVICIKKPIILPLNRIEIELI